MGREGVNGHCREPAKARRLPRTARDLGRVAEVAEVLRRAATGEDGRGGPDGVRRDLRKAARAAAQGLGTMFALLHASRTDEDARGRR
jgi:hypothetical protein